MKHKSHQQMMRRQQDIKYVTIAIVGIFTLFAFVGTIEYKEQRDKYDFCMFEAMPDDSREAMLECARKTGFYPSELNIDGGVK